MTIFDDMRYIPAIGLDPRFAGLVRLAALGYRGKHFETREKATRYRGPLCLASTSGNRTKNNPDLARCFCRARSELVPELVPIDVFHEATTLRSAAVAVGRLVDVRPLRPEDWPGAFFDAQGQRRFVWVLEDLWPLDPFPVTPAQLFFRVPVERVLHAAHISETDIDLSRACV